MENSSSDLARCAVFSPRQPPQNLKMASEMQHAKTPGSIHGTCEDKFTNPARSAYLGVGNPLAEFK